MADKSFGVRQINIAGSGTPTVDSSTSLIVNTNGSERVRITSSGDVGIGTTNPAVTVHVEDAQAELQLKSTSGTNSAGLRFVPGGATNALYIYADGSRNINFDDHATARLQIQSDGDLSISNGNLVFSTAGTGIDFSATSDAGGMTSELLDDYEEGTWTATFNGSFDNATGHYTKIGKVVHVQVYGDFFTQSFAVTAQIGGLPFTVRSDYSVGAITHNTWTANGGGNGYFSLNTTNFVCIQENSISSSSASTGSGKYFMMAGCYITD